MKWLISKPLKNYICIFFLLVLLLPAYTQQEQLLKVGKAFTSVAKKVSPGVVFIKVEKKAKNNSGLDFSSPFNDDDFEQNFLKRFFGIFPRVPHKKPQHPSQAQGSGFIVSSDGYIVTNHHVVKDASKITIRLKNRHELVAKVVGADSHSDVAVVKIEAQNLPVLSLGNSDTLEIGEWVVAVGNPFGLSHTITTGIISAKGRSNVGITDYEDFIQTDAAINPGNSGGPLVNLEGKVIGMNTAIFTRNGGYMGIGFAIPINMIKKIKDQLITKGVVTRGYLGVVIQELTPYLAKTFKAENIKGVLISQVVKNSPAEKAGLRQGDIIVEFKGKKIEKISTFRNHVALLSPGSKVQAKVLRKGKNRYFTITLGSLASNRPNNNHINNTSFYTLEKLGLTIKNITKQQAQKFALKERRGVIVTKVEADTICAFAGIRKGMLVLEVNHEAVENVEDFKQAIEKIQNYGTALLLVKDGEYPRYIAFNIEK